MWSCDDSVRGLSELAVQTLWTDHLLLPGKTSVFSHSVSLFSLLPWLLLGAIMMWTPGGWQVVMAVDGCEIRSKRRSKSRSKGMCTRSGDLRRNGVDWGQKRRVEGCVNGRALVLGHEKGQGQGQQGQGQG